VAAQNVPKANFGQRLVASLIDGLIVGAMFIPAWVALVNGDTRITTCRVEDGDIVFEGGPDNALCETPTGATWAIFALLIVAALVGAVLYYAFLEGRKGQTVGARAMSIKVVDIYTLQPHSRGKAVGRFFGSYLSGFPCGLGYLWMLWDAQAQTWHDKMTNSIVVRA
jgi:uncharacterized RDD family membrane protein YckC